MDIREIAAFLHYHPDIPAGKRFYTTLEGHMVGIEVICNRENMRRTPEDNAVIVLERSTDATDLGDLTPSIEEGQIVEEPQQNGAEAPNIEPGDIDVFKSDTDTGCDMPELQSVEGTEQAGICEG